MVRTSPWVPSDPLHFRLPWPACPLTTTDPKDPGTILASISDRLFAWPQRLLPQKALSGLVYRITRVRQPWFKNALIRAFCAVFKVNRKEAADPEPDAYPDFNAFFVRPLAAGTRPLGDASRHVLSPVDGLVSQAGAANGGELIQAKGRHFAVSALLGSETVARHFHDGSFTTLYLSPGDYHRVHMPLDGQLLSMTHIPGRLFSVNQATTRAIPALFARNERLVTLFRTPAGPMAVVLVGAMLVASIETVWAGTITPPYALELRHWDYTAQEAPALSAGDEMGRFNMGSTVIVLFPANRAGWLPSLNPGVKVQMGEALGAWRAVTTGKAASRTDAVHPSTEP